MTVIKFPVLVAIMFLMCPSIPAQDRSSPGNSANIAASGREDRHEGLSIVADPYTDMARAKDKFGKANPLEIGILPIEVFIRNETADPIRIDLNTVQLEVRLRSGPRQDIDWMTVAEVANAIAHPGGARPPSQRRLPVPVPLPSKDKNVVKLAEILKPLTLDADVIAPKGSVHGFLYFNVNRDVSIVSRSSLYVPNVEVIPTNKVLMFFDVPLGGAPRE